jgi:CRP-like cAMP-binding protein
MMSQLDFQQSRAIAQAYLKDIPSKLVQEALTVILTAGDPPTRLADFPLLEKVTYLYNSDFFHRLHTETLLSLAETSAIKAYSQSQVITEAGDTCRELLLLIEGDATIQFNDPNQQPRTEQLHAGQTLDELEVLAHSNSQTTIVADSAMARILAVPVDTFDALLDSDRDFARRVLELESRQLQRFMHSLPSL